MTTDRHPCAKPGRTKLALVSRGLALPDGLAHASRYIAQANAVEAVVDIRLPTGQFGQAPGYGHPAPPGSRHAYSRPASDQWPSTGGTTSSASSAVTRKVKRVIEGHSSSHR